jgi:hypothetical protein
MSLTAWSNRHKYAYQGSTFKFKETVYLQLQCWSIQIKLGYTDSEWFFCNLTIVWVCPPRWYYLQCCHLFLTEIFAPMPWPMHVDQQYTWQAIPSLAGARWTWLHFVQSMPPCVCVQCAGQHSDAQLGSPIAFSPANSVKNNLYTKVSRVSVCNAKRMQVLNHIIRNNSWTSFSFKEFFLLLFPYILILKH